MSEKQADLQSGQEPAPDARPEELSIEQLDHAAAGARITFSGVDGESSRKDHKGEI